MHKETHQPYLADAVTPSGTVVAELVMPPIGLLVRRPPRAVLYTLSDDSGWSVGVRRLDGIGAAAADAPAVDASAMAETKSAPRPGGEPA